MGQTKTKPKRGRPALPRDQKRGDAMHVRLLAGERQRLQKAADASGMTLTAYIRQQALRGAPEPS